MRVAMNVSVREAAFKGSILGMAAAIVCYIINMVAAIVPGYIAAIVGLLLSYPMLVAFPLSLALAELKPAWTASYIGSVLVAIALNGLWGAFVALGIVGFLRVRRAKGAIGKTQ